MSSLEFLVDVVKLSLAVSTLSFDKHNGCNRPGKNAFRPNGINTDRSVSGGPFNVSRTSVNCSTESNGRTVAAVLRE